MSALYGPNYVCHIRGFDFVTFAVSLKNGGFQPSGMADLGQNVPCLSSPDTAMTAILTAPGGIGPGGKSLNGLWPGFAPGLTRSSVSTMDYLFLCAIFKSTGLPLTGRNFLTIFSNTGLLTTITCTSTSSATAFTETRLRAGVMPVGAALLELRARAKSVFHFDVPIPTAPETAQSFRSETSSPRGSARRRQCAPTMTESA
jgi:hypothetical protein